VGIFAGYAADVDASDLDWSEFSLMFESGGWGSLYWLNVKCMFRPACETLVNV
jgi:hypothetical protein